MCVGYENDCWRLIVLSQCLGLMESRPELMRSQPSTTTAATSRSWFGPASVFGTFVVRGVTTALATVLLVNPASMSGYIGHLYAGLYIAFRVYPVGHSLRSNCTTCDDKRDRSSCERVISGLLTNHVFRHIMRRWYPLGLFWKSDISIPSSLSPVSGRPFR